MRVLVVAPHPDDEVLGVGGTLARFADEGSETYVVIVTRGLTPHFDPDMIAQGRREAAEAHKLLGVHETIALEIPAAAVDTVAHRDLNRELARVMGDVRPDVLFVPFVGDIHVDHQLISQSALVAARPNSATRPADVYAYETLSETNWNAPYLSPAFCPNTFVNITSQLDRKLEAMSTYASQVKAFPNERSIEALRALAMLRGSTVGVPAAEAFVQIRRIL